MNQLFRLIRYLLNRRRFDSELANDLEFHRTGSILKRCGKRKAPPVCQVASPIVSAAR